MESLTRTRPNYLWELASRSSFPIDTQVIRCSHYVFMAFIAFIAAALAFIACIAFIATAFAFMAFMAFIGDAFDFMAFIAFMAAALAFIAFITFMAGASSAALVAFAFI